ncbi:hypothetical protein BaRGS_00010499 [Batillaria attramentaria]|uniref:Uncharacterized protein n=1 Tax=Batillaria attramentaria TaxID=370345 RepID=A0ABD0LF89_9CAEN
MSDLVKRLQHGIPSTLLNRKCRGGACLDSRLVPLLRATAHAQRAATRHQVRPSGPACRASVQGTSGYFHCCQRQPPTFLSPSFTRLSNTSPGLHCAAFRWH